MPTETTRTAPEVNADLLNDFKTTIAAFNDGKVKGRLSPAFEEAMKLYIATMYLQSPLHLQELSDFVEIEDSHVETAADHQARVEQYTSKVSESLRNAVHRLPEDEPPQQEVESIFFPQKGGRIPPGGVRQLISDIESDDQERTQEFIREQVKEEVKKELDRRLEEELVEVIRHRFGNGDADDPGSEREVSNSH